MTITGVNDAPVTTTDDASTLQEDGDIVATGNVLANDTDVDQGTILAVVNAGVLAGQYGQLTLTADGSYSYALDNSSLGVQSLAEGQAVTESFAYQATDGIVTTPSTLTVMITGTNDAPVTTVDIATMQEDVNVSETGNVLANDTDVDQGAALSVENAGVFAGNYGQLILNADGSYSYNLDNASTSVQSLAAGQTVTESFAYQATDGMAATPSTLTVTITGTNDAPVAAIPLTGQTVTETSAFTYQLPSYAFTDIDQGDKLSYAAAQSNGSALPTWLTFDVSTQTFSSTLPDGAAGLWDITVTATDTRGASASSIFNLDVASLAKGTCGDDQITGSSLRDVVYGLGGNDELVGGNADDVLVGGSGNDIVEGGDGNDTLIAGIPVGNTLAGAPVIAEQCACGDDEHNDEHNDSHNESYSGPLENNLLDGGAGDDTLVGADGADLLIGGTGNDTIDTGLGTDIIAFNRGDGQDTVLASPVTTSCDGKEGADNTLSLGGGIQFGDLALIHQGNDLILQAGASDQITLKDWYASVDNHSIGNLQLIAGTTSSSNDKSDKSNNNSVSSFDFTKLVASFDKAVAANSATDAWSLTNAHLDKHLETSSKKVLGGDLAWQYAINGDMAAVSLNAAQDILGSDSFGSNPQQVNKLSKLKDAVVMLG